VLSAEEEKVLRKVLKEMNDAHGILAFWLKGSPIEATLKTWITSLESLLPKKEAKNEEFDCEG
jgi:hypothetical protein